MALVTVIPGTFTAPGLPTLGVKGFTDTFTRPDNTSIGITEGMPSRPWYAWVQSSTATTGIVNNEAYAARADGSGHIVAAVEAESADGTLEATMGNTAAAAQCGVAFRSSDVVNGWRFVDVQGSYYRLSKYVAGTNTHYGQSTGITPTAGDRIKVVLDGPSISCYVNDVLVTQRTDTDLQGLTMHGFYNNNDSTNRIRDIKFTAA